MGDREVKALGVTKDELAALELVKKLEKSFASMAAVRGLHEQLPRLDAAMASVGDAWKERFGVRVFGLRLCSALERRDQAGVDALVTGPGKDLVLTVMSDLATEAGESGKPKRLEVARVLLTAARDLGLGSFDELRAYVGLD